MGLIRVGDKMIAPELIHQAINKMLMYRSQGYSQQEVASRLKVDRSFVSRLESLGEIRRGRKLAVVGFPIANKAEIQQVIDEMGVDFSLLMNDQERWDFLSRHSGVELLDRIMALTAQVREADAVLIIGSNRRIQILQALLDREVIALEIGNSPIEGDVLVDVEQVREILISMQEKISVKAADAAAQEEEGF